MLTLNISHFRSHRNYKLVCFSRKMPEAIEETTLKHIPLISHFLTNEVMESDYAVR